ncbi:hypothetical protein D3C85_1888430 [compost metagenome]
MPPSTSVSVRLVTVALVQPSSVAIELLSVAPAGSSDSDDATEPIQASGVKSL